MGASTTVETIDNSKRVRRIVAPKENRTQIRLTIDSFYTQHYFNQLFAVYGISNKNALAEHIINQFRTKQAAERLQAFYKGPWLEIPFQRIDTSIVLPLTRDIRGEIDDIGTYTLSGVNRSKCFRVMVNFLAHVNELKKPVRAIQNY